MWPAGLSLPHMHLQLRLRNGNGKDSHCKPLFMPAKGPLCTRLRQSTALVEVEQRLSGKQVLKHPVLRGHRRAVHLPDTGNGVLAKGVGHRTKLAAAAFQQQHVVRVTQG